MIHIRGPDEVRRIDDPAIRSLVEKRLIAVCNGELYDAEIHGGMIVVETGDTAEALEQASGCFLLRSPFDDARFGDPDFSPSFEALEGHPGCYEMVFVLNDDGFGVLIFIPMHPGIDRELLSLCRTYAVNLASAVVPDHLI